MSTTRRPDALDTRHPGSPGRLASVHRGFAEAVILSVAHPVAVMDGEKVRRTGGGDRLWCLARYSRGLPCIRASARISRSITDPVSGIDPLHPGSPRRYPLSRKMMPGYPPGWLLAMARSPDLISRGAAASPSISIPPAPPRSIFGTDATNAHSFLGNSRWVNMTVEKSDPSYDEWVSAYEKLVEARKRLTDTAALKRTDRKRRAAYEYHRRAKAAYFKFQGSNRIAG